MYTELDQSFSRGNVMKGIKWNRPNDRGLIATVFKGISRGHQSFFKTGGYGFIIGDGNLNYGPENITEATYNAQLSKTFWLSLDYQFVNNPAYNKDRVPVHVFGIKGHVEF